MCEALRHQKTFKCAILLSFSIMFLMHRTSPEHVVNFDGEFDLKKSILMGCGPVIQRSWISKKMTTREETTILETKLF